MRALASSPSPSPCRHARASTAHSRLLFAPFPFAPSPSPPFPRPRPRPCSRPRLSHLPPVAPSRLHPPAHTHPHPLVSPPSFFPPSRLFAPTRPAPTRSCPFPTHALLTRSRWHVAATVQCASPFCASCMIRVRIAYLGISGGTSRHCARAKEMMRYASTIPMIIEIGCDISILFMSIYAMFTVCLFLCVFVRVSLSLTGGCTVHLSANDHYAHCGWRGMEAI